LVKRETSKSSNEDKQKENAKRPAAVARRTKAKGLPRMILIAHLPSAKGNKKKIFSEREAKTEWARPSDEET